MSCLDDRKKTDNLEQGDRFSQNNNRQRKDNNDFKRQNDRRIGRIYSFKPCKKSDKTQNS
jgi:hypothetical protein